MKYDSSSHRSPFKSSSIAILSQSIIVGSLIGGLLSITASPIYAWWFDSSKPASSITPTHKSGLVLSPLIQSVVPQFILEPLTTEEIETPPTAETLPESKQDAAIVLTPVATPQPSPQQQTVVAPASIAEQMLQAVNNQRAKHGLTALRLNTQLANSAQAYAVKMQQLNFFSHTDPKGGTFRQRNEAAGYTNWQWMGENIAYGQTSVEEVVNDWMNSPLHKANILEPRARELGVGYASGSTPYWVQEFGVQF